MNLPSATVTARDVPAAEGCRHVSARVSAGLSYVILLGGMSAIAVAMYTILVSYSSLPWWDTWEYIAAIAKGESSLSPSWLWRQHNEHRLVIQKLFFVVDLKMFHARQVFLLASIVVIQLPAFRAVGMEYAGTGRMAWGIVAQRRGLSGILYFLPLALAELHHGISSRLCAFDAVCHTLVCRAAALLD